MNNSWKLLLSVCLFPMCLMSQLNVDSISHIDYQSLHETMLNDVWGYTDELGNEYVLVGARKGTSIVSISNPENPIEIFWEPGTESIWRDLSTWGNYAYVTTEAQSGLMIIDLNSLPDPSGISVSYYHSETGSDWMSAHTLFIDANGYAYIFGSNRGNGGVIILDVHTDPLHPIEVGSFDNWYCHDGFVLNDTMYLAHISDGFISMVDITDKANPVLLGTKNTTNNFSHNIWTTASGDIGFTTDEVSGAFIGSYDLSDPQNIVLLDKIQSSPGKGVIPHNTHVIGNHLVTSYYSDGITVHDISRPANLVQIGNFDTYPGQTINFDGCWGVYPFFPSGLIAATDITEGLFILQPNYVAAAFLEGNVTDASSSNGLSAVEIQFLGENQIELSRSGGNYATGKAQAGSAEVIFSKVAYYPQTHSVSLVAGQVTNLDVALVPIPPFPLVIQVIDQITQSPILDAQIELKMNLITHDLNTNGLGEATFSLYYESMYLVTVGKWGYVTTCDSTQLNQQTGVITIYLTPGYYDDFTFDFGWTSTKSPTVTTGLWERANPNPTSTMSAPSDDAQFDCGDYAFVTGNNSNLNPDIDDVDHGKVTLFSPIFDASTLSNPYVNYARWFFNFHGPLPPADDTLEIRLSNGSQTVLIDQQGSEESAFYHWEPISIRILDFIQPTNSMQLIISVADDDPAVNITEAGIDFFSVTNASILTVNEQEVEQESIFPNPTTDWITLPKIITDEKIAVFNLMGKLVEVYQRSNSSEPVNLSELSKGIYFIHSNGFTFKVIKD